MTAARGVAILRRWHRLGGPVTQEQIHAYWRDPARHRGLIDRCDMLLPKLVEQRAAAAFPVVLARLRRAGPCPPLLPECPVLEDLVDGTLVALAHYGVEGWRCYIDEDVRRWWGYANFRTCAIAWSSGTWWQGFDRTRLQRCILHEVAHAVVTDMDNDAHGPHWHCVAREIGGL